MSEAIVVTSAEELADAIENKAQEIVVEGTISGSPSITLPEGATLRGGALEFGGKGVRLSKDNTLEDITITTVDYEVAVYNDTTITDAGTLTLRNVTTVGQVYIVADDNLTSIRVEADGLTVKEADVRGRAEQPHGFGVDVLQGGITLWNRQADASSTFTATLKGLSAGTPQTPIRGSGIFIAGHGDREGLADGGLLVADLVETESVEIDGGIAPDASDKISGGVFVVSGAKVDKVVNKGEVTTHGQNDMVLDNWGEVASWVATQEVRSTGASGIGFVNFGDIGTLDVQAPIVTTGKGARGFNLYDGSLKQASFDSIKTTGDGSIGIQVSKPMGSLEVRGDVETTGGEGMSLVRGKQTKLKAIALSVKEGGEIETVKIGGALRTKGDDVTTFEVLEGASIASFHVEAIEALGENSKASKIEGDVPDAVKAAADQ